MRMKLALGAALAGAALLGVIAVGFSSAQSSKSGGFTTEEEDEIREVVRDYILEHPDVILESVNAYAEREHANSIAEREQYARDNLAALLDERHGVVAGANPSAASVAVIEFFDYHCAFCKRASDFVKTLTEDDPGVKVVFRELPILREESDYAAEFALASRAQGKYTDLHFALLAQNGVMTKNSIKALAAKVGVNSTLVEKELKNPAIKEAIEETHRIASEMAIDGTPTFVIASLKGDFVKIVEGNRREDVTAAIAEAKKAAKK